MASETSPGIVDRVQRFVEEHKTAVLIGTGVAVALGGAAYYASTSGSDRDKKKKSPKPPKKRKSVKDADGPILEERKPKAEQVPDGACISHFLSVGADSREEEEAVAPTPEALAAMSLEVGVSCLAWACAGY
jgi:import receptor subunit TOM70